MTDTERLAVVERQIERLHSEALERIRNFSALWRTVILGVAGVLALGDKRDLDLIVLLSPALAMLVLAHWLNEQGSLALVGRSIAQEEAKANGIAGRVLLTYEGRRAIERVASLPYGRPFIAGATIGVSALYAGAVYGCLHSKAGVQYGTGDGLLVAYLALTSGAFLAAIINVIRLWHLDRTSLTSDRDSLAVSAAAECGVAADVGAADGAARRTL